MADTLRARLRAARGFSGKRDADLAAEIGVTLLTFRGWVRADGVDVPETAIGYLPAIAEATGVPEAFLRGGFSAPRDDGAPAVASILAGRLDMLQGAVLAVIDGRSPSEIRGLLGVPA